jgi:hypothetical protein
MSESFKLKPIHRDAIPEALEKAERYRLLNNPQQAESICRDILAIDPDHQEAIVMLVLVITDQFTENSGSPSAHAALDYVERLGDEYQRAYYSGIVRERSARAYLKRAAPGGSTYVAFREAMDWYERAEALRPRGNDDAILRWNSCVRTIERERLSPPLVAQELPLE